MMMARIMTQTGYDTQVTVSYPADVEIVTQWTTANETLLLCFLNLALFYQ